MSFGAVDIRLRDHGFTREKLANAETKMLNSVSNAVLRRLNLSVAGPADDQGRVEAFGCPEGHISAAR